MKANNAEQKKSEKQKEPATLTRDKLKKLYKSSNTMATNFSNTVGNTGTV